MTQENKELLLKDLSARLPYGVVVNYKEHEYDIRHWKIDSLHTPTYSESGILIDTDYEGWISFTEYKGCGMSTDSRPLHLEKNLPFLRPMSSMTEEEKEELKEISSEYLAKWENAQDSIDKWILYAEVSCKRSEFYNSHLLDWRGLIPKNLAIEAPVDMYKID